MNHLLEVKVRYNHRKRGDSPVFVNLKKDDETTVQKIQKLQEGEALRKTRTQSREECHGIIRELQLARVYRGLKEVIWQELLIVQP